MKYEWYYNGQLVEGHTQTQFYIEGQDLDFNGEYRRSSRVVHLPVHTTTLPGRPDDGGKYPCALRTGTTR